MGTTALPQSPPHGVHSVWGRTYPATKAFFKSDDKKSQAQKTTGTRTYSCNKEYDTGTEAGCPTEGRSGEPVLPTPVINTVAIQ